MAKRALLSGKPRAQSADQCFNSEGVMMSKSIRTAAGTLCAAAFLLVPAAAGAQVPTVSPDGSLSNPAAQPESSQPSGATGGDFNPAQPTIITIGPDGKPIPPEEVEDPSTFYYRDNAGGPQRENFSSLSSGPVPRSHVVRRGDTLWDICWFYFNNPWEWPRVWSYNPEITNPHWIYPGDLVRLYEQGGEQPEPTRVDESPEPISVKGPRPKRSGWFSLRQLAFVDRDKLEFAGVVSGSTDEKTLLSTGDTIYIRYDNGKPPKVGKKYAVYKERRAVKHPKSGKRLGSYVKIIGEVEILSVKKDKRARAIITDSVDVIERGHRVGPLQRQFKEVDPTPNKVDLQGTIVAQLFADELIGARQVVFVDKGTNDGVRDGNRFFVVRRGDALEEVGGSVSNKGQDDRRFPARAIGEVTVVQAGKSSAVCLVTLSVQEIEVGDLVLMRKSRSAE